MQWIAELSPDPIRHALRALAAILAASLVGCVSVSGTDPTLRTPGAWIDDEVIERMAARQIRAADEQLAISHVNVVSYDGIVLLTGQVEDQALRDLAQASIENIRKIRKIHNEIQVVGTISLVARGNDNWIQTKVKAKFIADGDVDASRIKVFVEDGTVYLMGLVPRTHADAAASAARNVFGVQRVVKVFDYVENSS